MQWGCILMGHSICETKLHRSLELMCPWLQGVTWQRIRGPWHTLLLWLIHLWLCSAIWYCKWRKDIEIQPGFEPGSSEFWSDALNLATGALALEQMHLSIDTAQLSFFTIMHRPVARIFWRGVTWMYNVYICVYKQARKTRESGGMLSQEIFRN